MSKITLASHFPSSKEKWKVYFKAFYPIILGSMLFAMNNFVDNFMVGGIAQGTASLSAANAWTNIIMGILAGTAASGSVILAQFYFAGNLEQARKVSNLRFLLSMFFVGVFFIMAQTMPDTLNKTFLSEPPASAVEKHKDWVIALDGAKDYMRIISFSWLLIAFTFNYGNQLRELGHARASMHWSFGTITTNIALNSILIYGLGKGIEGAAFASVAARCVALTWGIVYVYKYKIPLPPIPFMVFKIDMKTVKMFFRRWIPFFSVAGVYALISFRYHFYDAGYPVGSIADGVGGMLVLGLTGAIMNVFTTTFNALSAMSANFVASELGKGNIEQAKTNAIELKGFTTLVSFGFSVLLAITACIVPYMSFLSHASGVDTHAHLINVRDSLLVIAFYYPIWIWFSGSYRSGLTGGKGSWFALCDWIVTAAQIGWAAFVFMGLVPGSTFLQDHFWMSLLIFYVSDFIKLVWMEWLFYRFRWLHVITKNKVKV